MDTQSKIGMKYNQEYIAKRQALFGLLIVVQLFVIISFSGCSQKTQHEQTWVIADLLKSENGISVLGEPGVIKSPYGDAVLFDGVDDGILIDQIPLKSLKEYTIEMVIRFDSGGTVEQRVFHTGTMRQDRCLLEMRSNLSTWYFDGMVETNGNWVVLMDSTLLHPLDTWYHVAFTVRDGQQITYVNGKKELQGNISFTPILDGATSIGVRQNKISWFKGAIYEIRITDRVLLPGEFITIE